MNAPVAVEVPVVAQAPRRGVVLVNVGTPDAPTVPAVRRYLAEFLSDPRVVDLPAPARWMLLNLIILPFRPRRSAHAYQQIWTSEGSPLLLHSKAQVEALRQALPGVEVVLAMRYGAPSMQDALATLQARGVTHVTVAPMYPQYASATTGSTVEAWHRLLGAQVQPPASAVLPAFYARPGFIEACAERVRETVAASNADHVLFSYHGVPVRQLAPVCRLGCGGRGAPRSDERSPRAESRGPSSVVAGGSGGASTPLAGSAEMPTTALTPTLSPSGRGRQFAAPINPYAHACPPIGPDNTHCYRAQCFATSRAITAAAGLPSTSTSFQSRLKGATWLSPFTEDVVVALAGRGVKRLAVACPSFVADCLETLEEIGQRAAVRFREAGGESLTLVPAVNASPRFIASLAEDLRRSAP